MNKEEVIAMLDSGINIGETFEFEGGNVKSEQSAEFRRWADRCRFILIENHLVEQEKLDHPVNRLDDEREHGLLLEYLRKVYLMQKGML